MALLKKTIISGRCALTLALMGFTVPSYVKGEDRKEKPIVSWVGFGDLRGNIMPCGCDPLTDLGGMRRLAQFLKLEKVYRPNLLVLNLGNNYAVEEQNAHKNEFINRVLPKMKIDAALVNNLELAAFEHGQGIAKINYVLSNLRLPSRFDNSISPFVTIRENYILGYTSPTKQTQKFLNKVNEEMLIQWGRLKQSGKAKKRAFLLFSGTDDDLKKIAEAKVFDTIIRSNTKSYAAPFDHSEKQSPGVLLENIADLSIYQVPLGGIGVLRGGDAIESEAPTLSELLPKNECGNQTLIAKDQNCSPPELPKVISWLGREYVNNDVLKDEFADLNAANSQRFNELAVLRAKDLVASSYVGAEACKGCHLQAYEIWKGSAHAKAYKTLKDKAEHQNGECVTCHVVGYESKGGFASENFSPQFMNVQCENCHGPRKDHLMNPTKNNASYVATDVCVSCHVGAHSPKFNYAEYWYKIRHGK